MNRLADNIQPQDIVLLHVGGSLGSYGPIDAILQCFPQQSVVVAVEARELEEDRMTQSRNEAGGVRTVLINACIAETTGTSPFFVNRHSESSSMLPPGPRALDEHIVGYSPPGVTTWKQNTEVERTITLNTVSLHAFAQNHGLVPDVLSLDVQGMELRILKGAGDTLCDTNCIVSEVEFLEIYSGQGLFHDQMRLLEGYGFRVADFLNTQYWHPGPACGAGFLTVAEALWFKRIDAFLATSDADHVILRGIKLAAVAFAFRRYSYAFALMKELMRRDGTLVESLCRTHGFDVLLGMVREIDDNLANYSADNAYFSRHPLSWEADSASPGPRPNAVGLLGRTAGRLARFMLRLER